MNFKYSIFNLQYCRYQEYLFTHYSLKQNIHLHLYEIVMLIGIKDK